MFEQIIKLYDKKRSFKTADVSTFETCLFKFNRKKR